MVEVPLNVFKAACSSRQKDERDIRGKAKEKEKKKKKGRRSALSLHSVRALALACRDVASRCRGNGDETTHPGRAAAGAGRTDAVVVSSEASGGDTCGHGRAGSEHANVSAKELLSWGIEGLGDRNLLFSNFPLFRGGPGIRDEYTCPVG